MVDDDSVVRHSINRVLAEKGFEVGEAVSGKDALEELDYQRFDLVSNDLRMPGMDGLDMTARMKKNHPEMPVVVITGYGTEAAGLNARERLDHSDGG